MAKYCIVLCFALLAAGMERILQQTLFKDERVSQKALDATKVLVKTISSMASCGRLCREGCDAFKYDRLTLNENCRYDRVCRTKTKHCQYKYEYKYKFMYEYMCK